jgi:hypothetical protein
MFKKVFTLGYIASRSSKISFNSVVLIPFRTVSHISMDNLDLSSLDPDVRAVLVPVSSPAKSYLEANKQRLARLAIVKAVKDQRLPSPENSDDETKSSKGESRISSRKEITSLILRQTSTLHRFDLGSSPSCHILLRGNSKYEEETCYISLVHCSIYPNPEDGTLIIENKSASDFTVYDHRLGTLYTISSTNHYVLPIGWWEVSFGVGLDFLVNVLPRSDCGAGLATSIILDEKPTHGRIPKSLPPQSRDAKQASRGRSKQRALRKTRRVQLSSAYGIVQPSSKIGQVIGKTELTKVTIEKLNGRLVAAKVCRKPDMRYAAEAWKIEADTLKLLGRHVSPP